MDTALEDFRFDSIYALQVYCTCTSMVEAYNGGKYVYDAGARQRDRNSNLYQIYPCQYIDCSSNITKCDVNPH